MTQPNINNILKDERTGITYNVMAYKKLSREEIVGSIRYYHSQKKAGSQRREAPLPSPRFLVTTNEQVSKLFRHFRA